MGRWLVDLKGEPSSLEGLPYMFASPRLDVKREEGQYYLRSSRFAELTDAQEVREHASELVATINAILKVRLGYSRGIKTNDVFWEDDDGTRHRYVLLSGAAGAVSGTYASLSGGTPSPGPTEVEIWLDLALNNTEVMDALRFFEEETTWWSLRKTYEAIEKDFGNQQTNLAKKLKVDLQEVQRLKKWIHHYVHGELRDAPDPRHHPALSLGEAEAFLKNILTKWLRWKQRRSDNSR